MKHFYSILLLWSFLGCDIERAYGPDETTPEDSIVLLSVSPREVAANGYSIVTLKAKVPKNTKSDLRSLNFTTTRGSFVGASSPTSLTGVPVKLDGTVEVQLIAPVLSGKAYVSVTAGTFSRQETIEFTNPPTADKLQLNTSALTLDADGSSTIDLTIQLPTQLTGTMGLIKLSTTGGTFAGYNSTTIPDLRVNSSNGQVTVPLKASNKVETVWVSAETSAYRETKSIEFKKAYPSTLRILMPNRVLKAAADQVAPIEIHLLREKGIPTPGLEVDLTVFREDGVTRLDQQQFRATTLSNEKGIITSNLNVGSTSYRGKAYVVATVIGADPAVSNKEELLIANP
jgi:hypothetical protein